MNREIKFRAWDKTNEQMLDDVCTWTDDFTDTINGIIRYHQDKELGEEVLVFLQYTGLKDKNGTEIYEGDIIQGDPDGEPYQWRVALEVDRDFNGWNIRPQDIEDGAYIIGNIYENPELLEAKRKTLGETKHWGDS